jgi:stage IV sporulation protein FB
VNSSIQLGTIAGIEVRFEFTLAILCIFLIFRDLETGGVQAAIDGTLFVMLLLMSILLHELGHALAAALYRIRTTEIVLTFFGGYAAFEREPTKRVQEAVIALAGPTVNLAIAGGLYLTFESARYNPALFSTILPYYELFDQLMVFNFIIGVFNFLPAFPLDGGRATGAALSYYLPRPTARLIVARLGQVLALAIALYSFPDNPSWILLAAILFMMAMAEVDDVKRSS